MIRREKRDTVQGGVIKPYQGLPQGCLRFIEGVLDCGEARRDQDGIYGAAHVVLSFGIGISSGELNTSALGSDPAGYHTWPEFRKITVAQENH